MRALFSVTVTLTTPVDTQELYNTMADELAEAMSKTLAHAKTLEELTKIPLPQIQQAHTECEVTREDDETIVASCVLDLEVEADAVQLNKPMLSKHLKTHLGKFGKLKVEKRALDMPEAPAETQ